MPGFDRTGPLGAGPRTGRGLGFCAGGPYPPAYGGARYGAGRGGIPWGGGRGRAWGGGRGWFGRGRGPRIGWRGWGVYPPPPYAAYGAPYYYPGPPEAEREWLEARVSDLENELEEARKRLDEMKQEQEKE